MPPHQSIPSGTLIQSTLHDLQNNLDQKILSATPVVKRFLPIVLAIFVVVELLLLKSTFLTNYTPYYPSRSDQIATYLSSYTFHYSIRESGLIYATKEYFMQEGNVFRGWVIPMLGAFFAFLFGPNRLSIAYANFAFLLIGQIALWIFFAKKWGVKTALAAEGLLLCSRAFSASPAGGFFDLRFDFGGMIMFGICFMILISFFEKPNLPKLWLSLMAITISLSTRSITMVYLLGFVGLIFVYQLVVKLRNRQNTDGALKYTAWLFFGMLVIFAVFLALQWEGLNGYYGNLFRTTEKNIRDAEGGLSSVWERPLYYINSFHFHFLLYIKLIIGLVGGFIAVQVWNAARRRNFTSPGINKGLLKTSALAGAAGISVFTAVNLYAPSPVVISVLNIPLVLVAGILVHYFLQRLRIWSGAILTIGVILLGMGNFITSTITLSPETKNLAHYGGTINAIYEDLSNTVQPDSKVNFMLLIDGLHSDVFRIFWVEKYGKILPESFQSVSPRIFPITEEELLANLEDADIVVGPVNMYTNPNGGFEFPINTSIRALQPIWEKYLGDNFSLSGTYPWVDNSTLGIYTRNVDLVNIITPNQVESWGFWMGGGESILTIASKKAGIVTITADLTPGPSLPETPARRLQIKDAFESFTLELSHNNWESQTITFQVTVQPGLNEIKLIPLDAATVTETPNGDKRPLLIGTKNLKIISFKSSE